MQARAACNSRLREDPTRRSAILAMRRVAPRCIEIAKKKESPERSFGTKYGRPSVSRTEVRLGSTCKHTEKGPCVRGSNPESDAQLREPFSSKGRSWRLVDPSEITCSQDGDVSIRVEGSVQSDGGFDWPFDHAPPLPALTRRTAPGRGFRRISGRPLTKPALTL